MKRLIPILGILVLLACSCSSLNSNRKLQAFADFFTIFTNVGAGYAQQGYWQSQINRTPKYHTYGKYGVLVK